MLDKKKSVAQLRRKREFMAFIGWLSVNASVLADQAPARRDLLLSMSN